MNKIIKKKKFTLAAAVIILAAVAVLWLIPRTSPYDQYIAALENLKQAQYFCSQYSETAENYNETTKEKTITQSQSQSEYFVNGGNQQAITTMSVDGGESVVIYYLNGYSYSLTDTYRLPWKAKDAPLQAALCLVYNFPENVIEKQTALETTDGWDLNFVLDSEKYLNWQKQKYGYEGENTFSFSPAPVFEINIDKDGFLKSISGEINYLKTGTKIPAEKKIFSIFYSDINNERELDFSGLDETKYKDPEN